jgi:hypothetical protein
MSTELKPLIPENTCPYIDMIIEIMDHMVDQDNGAHRLSQATAAKALLEHVRESNDKLRVASKHWYERAKKVKR